MQLNSRSGRVMYWISVPVAVAVVLFVWLVIRPAIGFSVFFTVFAAAILIWNARLAYGRSAGRPGD